MIWVLELAASKVGMAVIFVASCVVALIVNNAHQRSIGAEKVVAKIEKATNETLSKAKSAGAKSAAGSGVRELSYRD